MTIRVSKLCLRRMPGCLYRRVNGNLRAMAKSNEMMRREIPNRIAQARVQAFKVRVIIFARKVKEKNNIGQLD